MEKGGHDVAWMKCRMGCDYFMSALIQKLRVNEGRCIFPLHGRAETCHK